MKRVVVLAAAAALGLGASAFGQVWNEMGTFGAYGVPNGDGVNNSGFPFNPAENDLNITDGFGPLSEISGSWRSEGDMDAYQIFIPNPGVFAAETVSTRDAALWITDAMGVGLAYNNDISGMSNQAGLSGANLPGPGLYWLVVGRGPSQFTNQFGEHIWDTAGPLTGERVPDGPATVGSMDLDTYSYTICGFCDLFSANYRVVLTGAEYAIPSPGASALLGVAGLVALRRRR